MKLLDRFKENFQLNSISQVYFWKSEWERFDPDDRLATVSIPYLIYRFLFLCFFIVSTGVNASCSDLNLYFIYLTNWTFTLQLIYALLYFTRLLWIGIKRRSLDSRLFAANASSVSSDPKLPTVEKIILVLINIVSAIPYGVSAIYWIFLFNPDVLKTFTTCGNASNFLVHAINSVMALLDSFIMAVPIRVSYMIFPILWAFSYCLFSVLYEIGGGVYVGTDEYIYPILDWRHNPGGAVATSVGGMLFALAGHTVFCWGIYRLRVILVNKYFCKRTDVVAQDPSPSRGDVPNSESKSNFAYDNPTMIDIETEGGTNNDEKGKPYSLQFNSDLKGYQS